MLHHKFSDLAQQAHQRRSQYLKKIGNILEVKKSDSSVQTSRAHQLSLNFTHHRESIEIFQQFDDKNRIIEWSYYTTEGQFLFEFGFYLKERSYLIYSIHPTLLQDHGTLANDLIAINQHLLSQCSGLKLICDEHGKPSLVQVKPN